MGAALRLASVGKAHLVDGGAKLIGASEEIIHHLQDLAARLAVSDGAIKLLNVQSRYVTHRQPLKQKTKIAAAAAIRSLMKMIRRKPTKPLHFARLAFSVVCVKIRAMAVRLARGRSARSER
jgi:hypothetical protein